MFSLLKLHEDTISVSRLQPVQVFHEQGLLMRTFRVSWCERPAKGNDAVLDWRLRMDIVGKYTASAEPTPRT